jgi:hypothetical protein
VYGSSSINSRATPPLPRTTILFILRYFRCSSAHPPFNSDSALIHPRVYVTPSSKLASYDSVIAGRGLAGLTPGVDALTWHRGKVCPTLPSSFRPFVCKCVDRPSEAHQTSTECSSSVQAQSSPNKPSTPLASPPPSTRTMASTQAKVRFSKSRH